MIIDETGRRFARAGRALGLLYLVILATAWTLLATPSLATAEPEGNDSFDLSAIEPQSETAPEPQCRYLRVAVQSPYGSDEDYQKPLRELLSTSLSRAGFEVVGVYESHYWWASSLALDNGSESAWTTVVRAVPELRAGGIRFLTTYKEVDGKDTPFTGMHSLRLFQRHDAPATAMKIADGIAQNLLPAVRQRCDESVEVANRRAEAELERMRSELTEEMERIRRNRARSTPMKGLELEVEQGATTQQHVSTGALPVRSSDQASAEPSYSDSPPASQRASR